MSTLRYYILDNNDQVINDPDKTTEYITDASFNTMWPKGYGTFSATVRRDIFRAWQVKMAQRIIVRDGLKSVYDGRLSAPKLSIDNGSGKVALSAQGWFIILNERRIRKRWLDKTPIGKLRWPSGVAGTDNQDTPVVKKEDKDQVLRYAVRPDDTNGLDKTDYYQEQYTAPSGFIYRVEYGYYARTGEEMDSVLYNDDQAAIEDTEHITSVASGTTSTVAHTFTQGDTVSFTLRIGPGNETIEVNQFDQNDIWTYQDFVVKCSLHPDHSNTGIPVYSPDEIVEDVLLLARGDEISADMSQIGGDSTALDAYITKGDDFQTAASIIEDLAAFSDSNQNTYGLAVWDGDSSSDSLPQAYFATRPTSTTTATYTVSVKDCSNFNLEETDSELFNWITVKWEDETGYTTYLTPDDDTDLKDTTSITAYGERHSETLDAGESTQADAKQMAERHLAYHKDPLLKGGFGLVGEIKRFGSNVSMPVSRVKAGETVYLQEIDKVVFIRETSYSVNDDRLDITPDIPADNATYELRGVSGSESFKR